MELELLGPPPKAELEPILAQIETLGGHYMAVGSTPGDFPFHTMATKDMTRDN